MNYVVTGAQGFVGRYLIAHILAEDPAAAITGIGRSQRNDVAFTHAIRWGESTLPAPLTSELTAAARAPGYSYVSCDLQNNEGLTAVMRAANPEIVFHMASGLRDDPLEDLIGSNVLGSVSLLEAIAASGSPVRSVVLGSSGGIYGVPVGGVPIHEDDTCDPVDYYSASKLASEHLTRIAARRLHIAVIWARLFNLVGPGQDERHVCGRFAAQAAFIAHGAAPPVMSAGNLDATRDFIDVRDIARALIILARSGSPGQAYNVASGHETSIRSVLDLTLRSAGLSERVELEQLPFRASDIPRHVADIGRLSSLGYKAHWTLERSVADTVAYYANEVAIRAAI